MDTTDTSTELSLEEVACMFLTAWNLWSSRHGGGVGIPFEQTGVCKKLIAKGLIATHVNPRTGDYAIQHKYTGTLFFTGTGELAFSSAIFAETVAKTYVSNAFGTDIQVQKIIAEY